MQLFLMHCLLNLKENLREENQRMTGTLPKFGIRKLGIKRMLLVFVAKKKGIIQKNACLKSQYIEENLIKEKLVMLEFILIAKKKKKSMSSLVINLILLIEK